MSDTAPRDANRNVTLQATSNVDQTSPVNLWANPSTHELLVTASITPSGTQDVNLIKVGGVVFALGQQLATSSLPVVLTAAQISTLTPLSTVAATQSGTWTVQPGNTANTTPWLVLSQQKDTFAAPVAFTITLASLANSTSGVGRQSTLVTSNVARSALIAVKFTVGTSPTANTLVYVYLLRGDGTLTDDGAGASDAGLTVKNAPLLGTILCTATSSDTAYYGIFDTKFLGSLGPTFGIGVVNSTGATANATGGNFTAEYTLIT